MLVTQLVVITTMIAHGLILAILQGFAETMTFIVVLEPGIPQTGESPTAQPA